MAGSRAAIGIPARNTSPKELWRAIQDLQNRIARISGSGTTIISGGGGGGGGGGTAVTATYSKVLTTWSLDSPVTVISGETWAVTNVVLGSSGSITLDGELLLLG